MWFCGCGSGFNGGALTFSFLFCAGEELHFVGWLMGYCCHSDFFEFCGILVGVRSIDIILCLVLNIDLVLEVGLKNCLTMTRIKKWLKLAQEQIFAVVLSSRRRTEEI